MDKIPLLYDINDEQLVHFCLEHIANCNSDDQPHPVAEKIVTVYAINELSRTQENFTEDEVCQRYQELIVEHILTGMVNDDLIEPDFSDKETKYSLTEEGKKHVNNDD